MPKKNTSARFATQRPNFQNREHQTARFSLNDGLYSLCPLVEVANPLHLFPAPVIFEEFCSQIDYQSKMLLPTAQKHSKITSVVNSDHLGEIIVKKRNSAIESTSIQEDFISCMELANQKEQHGSGEFGFDAEREEDGNQQCNEEKEKRPKG
jgi:hypothetical protein